MFHIAPLDHNAPPSSLDPNHHKSRADERIELTIPGLMETLRKQLAKRGSFGFAGLAKKFHMMDKDRSNTLSREEFVSGVRIVGVELSRRQMDMIFDFLDKDKNGSINFEEFLNGVRGELTPRRLIMVDRTFDELDVDGDGVLDFAEIMSGYNPENDPRVSSGEVTAERAKVEFLGAFEGSGAGLQVNGGVTRKEWQNFFANVSASVDSDIMFEVMLNNSWTLAHGVPNRRIKAPALKILITHDSGKESVEEISDEFGFRESDVDFNKAIVVHLKKHRGITATHLEVLKEDGSRRNPDRVDAVRRKPILGYKGHQHQRRERMGTTFDGWQAQRDKRDRERERQNEMIRTHGNFAPAGSSGWQSHTQQVLASSAAPDARQRLEEQNVFKHGIRWAGEVERGEYGKDKRNWQQQQQRVSFRREEDVEERELTKEDLHRDYGMALREVGGEDGVNMLIRKMSGALTQRSSSITALHMRVQKAFENADVDQSGLIDRDEFRKAMELLNYVSSEAQVVAIFGSLDRGATNHISVNAFVDRLVAAAREGFNTPSVSDQKLSARRGISEVAVGKPRVPISGLNRAQLARRCPGSRGREAGGERRGTRPKPK